MKEITRDELNEILRKHDLWLKGDFNGARANLNGANLCRLRCIVTLCR